MVERATSCHDRQTPLSLPIPVLLKTSYGTPALIKMQASVFEVHTFFPSGSLYRHEPAQAYKTRPPNSRQRTEPEQKGPEGAGYWRLDIAKPVRSESLLAVPKRTFQT